MMPGQIQLRRNRYRRGAGSRVCSRRLPGCQAQCDFYRRHENTSLLITTNLALAGWPQIFGDTKMTTAMLDRLAHHCGIEHMLLQYAENCVE